MTFSSSLGSLRPFVAPGAGFDYFATEAHYRSLAGRIIGALGGFSVIVVTSDPPASARLLSTALVEAAGPRHSVIGFSSGAEPGHRDVPHFCRMLSISLIRGGATGPKPASPLVVFDDTDRLSDEQIEEIFKSIYPPTQFGDRRIAAAVLLAHPEFLARLERPVLRFWLAKRLLVARLRFQELGADEIPAFIRDQLGPGEGEAAFTDEVVTAIANVSGGDPMVVNRFARRLSDFAGASTGDRLMLPVMAFDRIERMEMAHPEPGISDLDKPSTRMRRRGSAAMKLWAGIVACLGVTAVLLFRPDEEKTAAAGKSVTEAAVSIRSDASATGEAVRSDAPMAPNILPTLDSPPELATSWAGIPTAASTDGGGQPEETATAVATPALAASKIPVPAVSLAETAPTIAVMPNTEIPKETSTGSSPVPISPTAPPRLSAAEVAGLVAGGDRFFALRDIASARKFYERAVEAGDGPAALKLAKLFDPAVLAHLYGVRGDADIAAYWYSRARELGEAEIK